MKILSIETSCDETAISILEISEGEHSPRFTILGDKVVSQIDIHKEFGGVFPAVAKREHALAILPLFEHALNDAELYIEGITEVSSEMKMTLEKIFSHEQDLCERFIKKMATLQKPHIDAICVTTGPGLEPALWVGINFARALSLVWNIPIVPVNHMEGHVMSVAAQTHDHTFELAPIVFPALSLLVSGGHTELVLIPDWMNYEKIGETKDDAVGEAFDKVARILGLPYPGGPEITRLAQVARAKHIEGFTFPKPMISSGDFDFSYSGLKTSVLYKTKEFETLDEETVLKIARGFEDSAIAVLAKKTLDAVEKYGIQTVMVGGGVANNTHLQSELIQKIKEYDESIVVYFPRKDFSTDNSLMIGVAGYFQFLKNKKGANVFDIRANGNWSL